MLSQPKAEGNQHTCDAWYTTGVQRCSQRAVALRCWPRKVRLAIHSPSIRSRSLVSLGMRFLSMPELETAGASNLPGHAAMVDGCFVPEVWHASFADPGIYSGASKAPSANSAAFFNRSVPSICGLAARLCTRGDLGVCACGSAPSASWQQNVAHNLAQRFWPCTAHHPKKVWAWQNA